jgi:hypothetical protein
MPPRSFTIAERFALAIPMPAATSVMVRLYSFIKISLNISPG